MRPINNVLVSIGKGILWPITHLAMRLKVEGREHLPPSGAVLLVCNHRSIFDPPLVGMAQLPGSLYFMAKKELFWGVFGAFISRCGAFPVDRGGADRDAVRTAREVLQSGQRLLMFPEGTRNQRGDLLPALPGAGSLGLIDGVTVIPAAIVGSNTGLRTGVRVRFGPPVDLSGLEGSRGARSQQAADRMMDSIRTLLAEMSS